MRRRRGNRGWRGGNSAGQAAVFLAQTARKVHMLIRGKGLADSMSRYLIRRIEESPAIELRPCTGAHGARRRRTSRAGAWRTNQDRPEETHDIQHVFVMTGAAPSTMARWLPALDARDSSRPDPISPVTS